MTTVAVTDTPTVPRRWAALVFIALAQLMVVLDATVVNIALPSAQKALGISAADRQWVITAYTLVFGGLLLFGGRIADLAGRKRTFLVGLLGFAGASAIGGAATGEEMLFGARALQGAFGALLAPSALSLLAVSFTRPRERAKAFGIYGAIAGGGAAAGLMLGGVLTEYLDWRWALYVNVPIAVIAFVGASILVRVPPSGGRARHRLDVPGAVLVTGGLVALVYGFTRAESEGWRDGQVLGLFAASAILIILFVVVEAVSRAPLLPLRVVTDRRRGGAYIAVGLAVIAMFGLFLFLTYYMQVVKGYSPVKTGLAFLPFTAGMIIGSTQIAARLMHRVPARALMVPGLLVAGLGMWLLTHLRVDSSYPHLVLPSELLIGLGLGSNMMPAMNLATTDVAPYDSGVASAMVNTAQQVGGSIGTALLNTIAATATTHYLADRAHGRPAPALVAAAQVHGYASAIWWCVGIILLAALVVAVMIKGRPRAAGAPAGAATRGGAGRPEGRADETLVLSSVGADGRLPERATGTAVVPGRYGRAAEAFTADPATPEPPPAGDQAGPAWAFQAPYERPWTAAPGNRGESGEAWPATASRAGGPPHDGGGAGAPAGDRPGARPWPGEPASGEVTSGGAAYGEPGASGPRAPGGPGDARPGAAPAGGSAYEPYEPSELYRPYVPDAGPGVPPGGWQDSSGPERTGPGETPHADGPESGDRGYGPGYGSTEHGVPGYGGPEFNAAGSGGPESGAAEDGVPGYGSWAAGSPAAGEAPSGSAPAGPYAPGGDTGARSGEAAADLFTPRAGRGTGGGAGEEVSRSAIHGSVHGAGGLPLPGATLTIVDLGGRQIGRGVSGDDGAYALPVPGPGAYVLIATGTGHRPRALTVVVGDEPLPQRIALDGTAGLTGVVRGDRDGAPIAGAVVVLADTRGEIVASGETDTGGTFTFHDLLPGLFTLAASARGHRPAATLVQVEDDATARSEVRLAAGVTLRGTVRAGAERRPLGDARVTLVNAAGDVVAAAVTGADGEYAFHDLDPGSYTVIAAGYPPVAGALTVDGSGRSGFDVTLGHADEPSTPAPRGVSAAGADEGASAGRGAGAPAADTGPPADPGTPPDGTATPRWDAPPPDEGAGR